MGDPPELDRLDTNLLRATGAFLATSKTGEVLESRDLFLTSTGLAVRDFNVAFPKLPATRAEKALERASRYFEAQDLPWRAQMPAELADGCRNLLERRGFVEADTVPGMLLDPIPEAPPLPEELRVRRVGDDAPLDDFQVTAFEGFGLPTVAAPLFLTAGFVELAGVALFVGYVGDEPVCTSALVATGGVAGIYWVATRDGFRKRGFGEAVTWCAVRQGRELGCRIASLQASELGRPVYARMGFRHVRDYARFDSPEQPLD